MHTQPQLPQPQKNLSKQKSFSISLPKLSFYFLVSSVSILILLQIQALKLFLPFPLSSPSWATLNLYKNFQKAPENLHYLPLKDLRFAETAMEGNTWFMSSINDTIEDGVPEHLLFPSSSSSNKKYLCILGHDSSNGTRNFYALASEDSLPSNAKWLPGLTYISDTYFDYENLYHGLTTIVPFAAWYKKKECVLPSRFVLYHWGEVRKNMSPWVGNLAKAVFGSDNVKIKTFEDMKDKDDDGTRPNCFEKAVVFRHNEGKMSKERKQEVYGMMRCKTRAYCNVSRDINGEEDVVRLTLLLRSGARSFKDEEAVIQVFEEECRKVDGCRLKVARPNNLTFCDQVSLMTSTDIVATAHGAQLTNMIFMDKNSSIMEFFPKGWLELAGPGQYAFHWIAPSTGVNHKGTWRDPNGEQCPDVSNPSKCFSFYKDGRIGHDEKYFAKWASDVINEMKAYKLTNVARKIREAESSSSCACS